MAYWKGDGVKPSHRATALWLSKAAKQGHQLAQCWFGIYHYEIDRSLLDRREAFKWLGRAAEQGHPEAQFYLAKSLSREADHKYDYEEIYWFKEAAKQGHEGAKHYLDCGIEHLIHEARAADGIDPIRPQPPKHPSHQNLSPPP